MNTQRIVKLGSVAALVLSLPIFLSLPASACRVTLIIEEEALPIIRGIPFPDSVGGLSRKKMQIPRCPHIEGSFSVVYEGETNSWAKIGISDRPPGLSADKIRSTNEANAKWFVDFEAELNPKQKHELISSNIGGKSGLSILIRDGDGAEHKSVYFNLITKEKLINIHYHSPQISLAEEKALAFRNSYLVHLRASGMESEL